MLYSLQEFLERIEMGVLCDFVSPQISWNKKKNKKYHIFGAKNKPYYKLFTFLSVDIEILTPWSSQVHPEAQRKGVQATEGC